MTSQEVVKNPWVAPSSSQVEAENLRVESRVLCSHTVIYAGMSAVTGFFAGKVLKEPGINLTDDVYTLTLPVLSGISGSLSIFYGFLSTKLRREANAIENDIEAGRERQLASSSSTSGEAIRWQSH